MVSLRTDYLGLNLSTPLIVGSSGLTNSVKNIVEFEKLGAGAVVLKSLFEEQIQNEINYAISQDASINQYPEAIDYISNYSKANSIETYLQLIRDCKNAVKIPIIASINCVSASEWMDYAIQIEQAGADALELNVFVLPSNPNKNGADNEKLYFEILAGVKQRVSIPISIKLSSYFSGLAEMIKRLDWSGANGLVLFNRFYSPDIDINSNKLSVSNVFSSPNEIFNSLRWIAILSGQVKCDLSATTGVHDAEGMIKMLLAGAKTVEIVSTLYQNGNIRITEILDGLKSWMEKMEYKSISDFNGIMSYKNSSNPAAYERVQFMKHFAGIE
jgi:dihydroorotate dehydrogenase (fumarate)